MTIALTLNEQLMLAINLASTHHFGQFDKGGEPYILHCLKVMHYTKSERTELKIAAVLHDIVEDTKITLTDLRLKGINEMSIGIIDALTKKEGQTPQNYLTGILRNHGACIVKLADLRHNSEIRRLKGLGDKDLLRMKKYHEMHVKISEAKDLHERIGNFSGEVL